MVSDGQNAERSFPTFRLVGATAFGDPPPPFTLTPHLDSGVELEVMPVAEYERLRAAVLSPAEAGAVLRLIEYGWQSTELGDALDKLEDLAASVSAEGDRLPHEILAAALSEISHVEFKDTEAMQAFARDALARAAERRRPATPNATNAEQGSGFQSGVERGEQLRQRAYADALRRVAAEHDEGCACAFKGTNEHGVHEDDLCDCARKVAREALGAGPLAPEGEQEPCTHDGTIWQTETGADQCSLCGRVKCDSCGEWVEGEDCPMCRTPCSEIEAMHGNDSREAAPEGAVPEAEGAGYAASRSCGVIAQALWVADSLLGRHGSAYGPFSEASTEQRARYLRRAEVLFVQAGQGR